ncbi:MAG: DUF1178 family protein [Geminicoccaceae bacterium]
MICFTLQCADLHRFEAWFRNGETYDEQAAAGQIECPVCGNRTIEKAPMAPAITKPKAERSQSMALQARQFARALKAHVEANFESVGERFPEEARKIHYGEAEERSIYGQATVEQAKELVDEGIKVAPIPDVPDHDA